MIKFIKNMSIKYKIILSFLLITGCLFGSFYYMIYMNYFDSTLNQTEKVADQLYKTVNFKIGLLVNQVYSCSNQIRNDENMNNLIFDYSKENDPNKKNIILRDILDKLNIILRNNQEILTINLYINNEHIYANSRNNVLVGEYLLNTEWYQDVYSGEDEGDFVSVPTYEQQYLFSQIDGSSKKYYERVISYISPIKNKDDINVVLAIDYEESYIANFSNLKLTNNSFDIICRDNGDIISSNKKSLIGENIEQFGNLNDKIVDYTGSFKTQFDGQDYNGFYNTFYLLNWRFLNFVPTNELIMDEQKDTLSFFIGLYIISNILIGVLIFSLVSKPLKNLLKFIRRIKNEDFSSRIKVKNNDEIGHIGKHFNEMIDSIETLLKENYMIKLQEKEAQIKTLQAQINPHFIYNILDIISWKAMLMQTDDINKITYYLGKFLRYCINDFEKKVSLEEDIEYVKDYLYIQKIRYTNRFKAYFKIEPGAKNLKVPKLLIQPIVENAIKHGLANKESHGILYIKIKVHDNALFVYVVDNGCGISKEKANQIYSDSEFHLGIKNVDERIKILSNKQYGVTINSVLGRYTKVTLKYPIINMQDD